MMWFLLIFRQRLFCLLPQFKNKQPLLTKIQHREYIKTPQKIEERLKRFDHCDSKDYQLIYRQKEGTFTFRALYHGIVFLTCFTFGVGGYHMYNEVDFSENEILGPFMNSSYEIPVAVFIMLLISTCAFIVVHRYPIRIYYNHAERKYRAIFVGKIPFTREFFEFPAGSCVQITRNYLNPFSKNMFIANGRKMFIIDEQFRNYDDFLQMLDYQDVL